MKGPLDGLVVFDLTRILAGPHCTQILGDLGAEVIKIERPGAGDDTRNFAPPYLPGADGEDSAESAYFAGTNRNKRSVTLDLRSAEGQDVARAAHRGQRRPGGELQGRHAREVRARLRRPAGRLPRPHLLLRHRLRPDRAVCRTPGLRRPHPGDGRGHEHHRRAGRGADEGRGVHRGSDVGDVCGGGDPRGGARPAPPDRRRAARGRGDARYARGVARRTRA